VEFSWQQHQRSARRHPPAEKRRIVELRLRVSVAVFAIAREHGVHPTSLQQLEGRSIVLESSIPQAKSAPRVPSPSASPFVPVAWFLPCADHSRLHAPTQRQRFSLPRPDRGCAHELAEPRFPRLLVRPWNSPAGGTIPNINSARVSFRYNVVDLFRALRGGCVLGIIACGR
jgi:hypothetical protein